MLHGSGINFVFHHERHIDAQALRDLYDAVAWWPNRSTAMIEQMLAGAQAVGAWDGDHLIGFARAVSDQHFRAYIEDVAVHPEYRRCGIGQRLLAELLNALAQIETVSLFCEPELVHMYEQHGFRARTSHVVMHRRRS